MRRRLLLSTGLIALVAVLVLGVPLGLVGTRLLRQRAEARLEREADAAAVALGRPLRAGKPADARAVRAPGRPGAPPAGCVRGSPSTRARCAPRPVPATGSRSCCRTAGGSRRARTSGRSRSAR